MAWLLLAYGLWRVVNANDFSEENQPGAGETVGVDQGLNRLEPSFKIEPRKIIIRIAFTRYSEYTAAL